MTDIPLQVSPLQTQVTIDCSFSDLDPNGGDGIAWFIERNSSNYTISSGSLNNGGSAGNLNFVGISVNAGDRINFIVGPAGNYAYDSTRVSATITMVPEPALATFGLLGMSVWTLARPKRQTHLRQFEKLDP
jgi:hypothetical protein